MEYAKTLSRGLMPSLLLLDGEKATSGGGRFIDQLSYSERLSKKIHKVGLIFREEERTSRENTFNLIGVLNSN